MPGLACRPGTDNGAHFYGYDSLGIKAVRQQATQLRTSATAAYQGLMNATEAILMMAFVLPLLLAMSWAREELRRVEPVTRFGFGIATFVGSLVVLYAIIKLLPGQAQIEGDLLGQMLLMGGASIVACGLVLSVALIGSATWQAFKRWKFHRSNVS